MKKIIIWIVAVVLVLSAGVFAWFKFWNKPVEAPKTQEKPPVADSKEPVDAAKVQAEIIELTEKQKKEPQNVDNALELAAAYAKLGKIDEARGAINNVAALVPGDTRLYIEMVNIYESKGRYLDALLFVDGINDANAKKITETKLRDQGFGGYAGFGNSAGNIANEGCVAADDKYVYYSESQDGGALYRADLDGKNKLKLSDGKTRYINVVGDTLYFSNIDDGYFIYTVKNDGTGRKKIVNKLAQKLTIFDDRLYFVDWSDSCKVHSVKLDGSDDKVFINVPVHELSLSGAWFMYTNSDDNESLYRIRVDGKANEKLGNENALFVNADREYAYYANWSDGGKLYRSSRDVINEKKALTKSKVGYVNVSNDWIYYVNWVDGAKIYKMKLDGTENKKVGNDAAANISVKGDKIYYYNGGDGDRLYTIGTNGKGREVFGN